VSGQDRTRGFRAFGLAVTADLALPGVTDSLDDGGDRAVHIRLAEPSEVRERFSGDPVATWETTLADGAGLRYDLGPAGDHRVVYGETVFHLDDVAAVVLCAIPDRAAAAWQRQLLDTVLFTVSFVRGFELLHAGAVVTSRGAVALAGRTGAGKSSLVAELMRRGHRLLSDDVVAVDAPGDGVMAFPGPAVMNLPAGRSDLEELGAHVIARFDAEDEQWVVIRGAAREPSPLAALFVLDPGGPQTGVQAVSDATFLDLAPYTISLPHDRHRAQRRFDALSTLADRVPVNRLSRGPRASPEVLADHVERWLGLRGADSGG
jgi:hypothetical protein